MPHVAHLMCHCSDSRADTQIIKNAHWRSGCILYPRWGGDKTPNVQVDRWYTTSSYHCSPGFIKCGSPSGFEEKLAQIWFREQEVHGPRALGCGFCWWDMTYGR